MKKNCALWAAICLITAVSAGCEDTEIEIPSCNPAQFKPQCAQNNSYLICNNGVIVQSACPVSTMCIEGTCQPIQKPALCIENARQCSNLQPQICQNNNWVNIGPACTLKCDGGVCIDDAPVTECTENALQCSGRQPQKCTGGKWIDEGSPCAAACEQGRCIDVNIPASCGNNTVEAGEACDGTDLGSLTCKDLGEEDVNSGAVYTGKPECKSDCSGITAGTCQATMCGNNNLDLKKHNEVCDVVDGKVKFANGVTPPCDILNAPSCGQPGQPTCYKYEPGGIPGCNSKCTGYSKGSCKIIAQPMDGIQSAHFTDLEYDGENGVITGKARIITDKDIGAENVTGYLACGRLENPTYTWSLKSEKARFMQECPDCAEDEYSVVADITAPVLGDGTYDCVFKFHVNAGQESTSYYLSPIEYGFPAPEGVADSNYVRQFTVGSSGIQGTVIAHWAFSGYQKTDPVTKVTTVSPDDGTMAEGAQLKTSDGSDLVMLTGTGTFPEAAAAMDRLSMESEYSENSTKYISFNASTKGYTNIRIQYNTAGSGVHQKTVRTMAKTAEGLKQVGGDLAFTDKNTFVKFPISTVVSGENLDNLEIRIYTWGAPDANATIRVDDFFILGDPIAVTP